MNHRSVPELLALHGVRILGGPTVERVAERFRLDPAAVREHLLDAQAYGWVTRYDAFGQITWSLTTAGHAALEQRLSAELDTAGARETVTAVHRDFLPLNVRHGEACTRWQLRPTPWDQQSFNDHTDLRWDEAVLTTLDEIDAGLAELCARLTGVLARFDGHAQRHHLALQRVRRRDRGWLDAPDRASCQLVWMQFHEDLLATLGIPRGSDG